MADQGQSAPSALLATPGHDATHQEDNILSDLQEMMATNRRQRIRSMSTQSSMPSRSRSEGSLKGKSDILDRHSRDTSQSSTADSTHLSTAEENTSRCPTARLLSFSSEDSLDIHQPTIVRTARENSAFSDTSAGSTGATAISPMIGQHFSDLATAIGQSRGRSPTMRVTTNSQTMTPREAWSKVPIGMHSVIRPAEERPQSTIAPSNAFFSFPVESSATSGTSTPYTTTESTSLMDFSTARSGDNSREVSEKRPTSGVGTAILEENADLTTAITTQIRQTSASPEFRTAILEETASGRTGSPHFSHLLLDDDTKTAKLFEAGVPETICATIVLGAPGSRAVSLQQNPHVLRLVNAGSALEATGAITNALSSVGKFYENDATVNEYDNVKAASQSSSNQNDDRVFAKHNDGASTLQNLQDSINDLNTARAASNDASAVPRSGIRTYDRTSFDVPIDQLNLSNEPSTFSLHTAKENPTDYGSPVSASGSRPPSVYERDHWDLARNANSDQNSTLREKKDHRGGKTVEENELEIQQVAALIADAKIEAEQQVNKSMSSLNTATEAPTSPTPGVATAHEWTASPTHGVKTALEVPMTPTRGVATAREWTSSPTHEVETAAEVITSPTKGVYTALEIPDTPTTGVITAIDLDQKPKDIKTSTATSSREFSTAHSSLNEHWHKIMGPDILDSSRLVSSFAKQGPQAFETVNTPLWKSEEISALKTTTTQDLFTTRPPCHGSSYNSDVSVPTPIPSPYPIAEVKKDSTPGEEVKRKLDLVERPKPRAGRRGLFGTNQKQGIFQSSRMSPARVSPNLYPERRQMIVTMRSRQSKSRSPSRSRSSQSTDSRMQTASLGSSLHSDYSASSSKKAPSDSGQRLGGTDVGKACSRLLRENPPSTRPQKDLETVETGHMRRMSMSTAVRSTATESSIREANSTTVLSSAPSSRLGLCSSRRQSASSATTSGSRFGRRIRPGDGYPTSTGTSSRSGMESRRSFHLPASRFGLPPPPQGWEERQRQSDSLSVEPEVVEKSLQKSEKQATTVINANPLTEEKISKNIDATLKTARPLKSKKLRKPRPQDTRPSYYGLHGRIKRISRKSKRKATNHLAASTVHPEEAPTQQISPDAFSARRIHDQASPRLKTAIESLEKGYTQTGVKPAKIVIHEQNADGSFKLEVHVDCKMNSSGRMNISGTTPEGLTPKRVTVNGKNIWAGS